MRRAALWLLVPVLGCGLAWSFAPWAAVAVPPALQTLALGGADALRILACGGAAGVLVLCVGGACALANRSALPDWTPPTALPGRPLEIIEGDYRYD